jgi:hypothetical protein
MVNFEIYNVSFCRVEKGTQMMVRGEITNKTGRDYNAVAIRVVLFKTNIPIVNTVVVVNGLPNGRNRTFEKVLEELDYNQVVKEINRQEAYVESAY